MDFKRIFDILPYQNAKFPQQKSLVSKKLKHWKAYSSQECLNQIDQLSSGLLDKGVKKGDKFAILSFIGSPEWNFLDFGIQQIGAVVVPIHATVNEQELEYILHNAEVKYCFVSNTILYQKIRALDEKLRILKAIFSIEKIEGAKHWTSLQTQPTAEHIKKIKKIKSQIKETDIATIIYTSGTTGKPKGVMLSHKNIVSNIKSIIPLIPINYEKKALSFLPMSHIFERMVTYTYMAVGTSVYYADRADRAIDNIKEVQPNYFTTVPRLFEKMYDSILDQAEERGGLSKRIIHWAIGLGLNYEEYKKPSLTRWLQHMIADLFVYRKWRNALGNKLEGVIVGAAALRADLGRLFSAAGINIREGYGLTETSPVVSLNRFEPGGFRFGTVGIAVPGVEINIENKNEEGEGEIVVRGPNVMMGYYKMEEETSRVISEDGWFKTGDVGKISHKRFLQITDRKKDIFKTSSGKYIAPQALENKLKASHYINQVMVIGFNRPFVTALIVPNFEALKIWCTTNGVHWTAPQFMAINIKVVQLLEGTIDQINEDLASHKKIKKFHLHHEEWSPETGEYTPTLKLKRGYMNEKFQKEITQMYS